MPGRSRVIDPVTRDYVADGKGGRKTTASVATSLYHAFQGRRDQWPGDETHGCGLWRIARDRLSKSATVRAENELRTAAQPFLDEGLLRSYEVRVERDPVNGRLLIEDVAVDAQAGPIDLRDVVAFDE